MDPLEKEIESMRLAVPSAELDRRVGELFTDAHRRAASGPAAWLPPLAGIAALACAAAVLINPQPLRGPEPIQQPVVYRIEAQGLMREMLLGYSGYQNDVPSFTAGASSP